MPRGIVADGQFDLVTRVGSGNEIGHQPKVILSDWTHLAPVRTDNYAIVERFALVGDTFHLLRLRQDDPVRRILVWTAVYVAGVLSGPIIKLIEKIV
jgi:hypothetical protein